MTPKFRVRLKKVHDESGLSPYAIAKELGMSKNTVRRYVEVDEVVTEKFEGTLLALILYYGVDWRDPEIVDVIEDPELKNPLLASA